MSRHRVAVMQPYFLPYLGYWQLLAAVDTFVVYDTVQFSSGGWINRNRVRLDGRVRWLTVPLARAPHRTPIAGRSIADDPGWREAMLQRVEQGSRSAPCRDQGLELLRTVLDGPDGDLADFLVRSIGVVAERLGIPTTVLRSSELGHPTGPTPQARVISLCRRLGADEYLNLSGGAGLYDPLAFGEHGIDLRFHVPGPGAGPDHGGDDLDLSILDLLLRRPASEVSTWAHRATWTGGTPAAGTAACPAGGSR